MGEAVELDELRADCGRCAALCCVVPAFVASADFAIDKPARTPCPNLGGDHRCGIHSQLRERGFAGCTVYDCFGAGQQVVQVTFGGRDWQDGGTTLSAMADVFPVMRVLHELLAHLRAAQKLAGNDEITALAARIEELRTAAPDDLVAVDVAELQAAVARQVRSVSRKVRGARRPGHRNAPLIGASLRRADLRRADLGGALLIGADLRGADLRGADLIGADLRGADLRGADLTGALFVVQAQLDAARGDHATRLPDGTERPAHWAKGSSGTTGPDG